MDYTTWTIQVLHASVDLNPADYAQSRIVKGSYGVGVAGQTA